VSKRKITVEIQNKQLNALEDLLFVELTEKKKAAATKQVKQLWQALVAAYDKEKAK
jgi:hypothetical protein